MTLQSKVLLLASIGYSYSKVVEAIKKIAETGEYTAEQAVDLLLEKNNIRGLDNDEEVLD